MSRTDHHTGPDRRPTKPPRVATTARYSHAEGPFWDAPRHQLLWVDITQGQVLSGVLAEDGTITETGRIQFPHMVGAVAPSLAGDWIVAGQDGILFRHRDGTTVPGPTLLSPGSGRRLNDGKPDPQGRFLVGTLPLAGSTSTEELFLLDGDEIRSLDGDLTLSNGLAWTADGTVMYSIDSETRTIFRRPWSSSGPAGRRDTFVVLGDGYPDGMTIDAADHLWVAVWGLGRLHRYDPTGRLVDTVDLPAPHPSSVVFAGDELRTLVVTTSIKDLTADQLDRYPDSGGLFTLRPDTPGRPQPVWAGPATRKEPTP